MSKPSSFVSASHVKSSRTTASSSSAASSAVSTSVSSAVSADVVFSPSQRKAFDAIMAGKSIFLTGGGGTGKSFVIKEVCKAMDSRGQIMVVTATTGAAAVCVDGKTLHSFLRLSPSDADNLSKGELASKTASSANYCRQVSKIRVIVIDESSMLTPRLFEQADWILRALRNNFGTPFGGMQVVLCGDFFQLPPVNKVRHSAASDAASDTSDATFIFQTPLFYELVDEVHELKEVWRQSDPTFVGLLNRMRRAEMTQEDKDILAARVGADVGTEKDGILPTLLYSTNVNVDNHNATELAKIKAPSVHYHLRKGVRPGAKDARGAQWMLDKLVKDLSAPEELELKEGAQVMLTYNLSTSDGLVNGSRGVVVGFRPDSASEKKAATKDEADDSDDELQELASKVEAKKLARDKESAFSLKPAKTGETPMLYPDERLPIVRFETTHGVCKVTIPYVTWTREDKGTGEVYAWQVPLRLAWATTVHKSQGASLDRVEAAIDKGIFAEGQAYVAVSRARSLQGLRLTSFMPDVVRANPLVSTFYDIPYDVQRAAALEKVRQDEAEKAAARAAQAKDIKTTKADKSVKTGAGAATGSAGVAKKQPAPSIRVIKRTRDEEEEA